MRVVPITVEGGRVIENRGEETNNIKIKYEESYTEDFRNQGHSKTQHEKNEKKVPNRPDMNNEKGRIIPIKLSEEYSRVSHLDAIQTINKNNSADGGPRSRVCARETLRSAPHRH